MTEESEVGDVEILEASAEETARFEHYKQGLTPDENGQVSIDIPFGFTVGAATVAGIFHLRDPIEDSSAEGVVAGVINGTFKLNRKKTSAKFYDPTGSLLRMVIELNLQKNYLRARVDTRKPFGGWSKGSWVYARF
ncbi:hypothetical protein [Qipengyuania flava]|uniref:hypothetical protein n=1 Tax=Qipengyuania flava TaxID=192812 RepID=UPI00141B274A|nr:hypothetical protein [Qipengyuania flava]NIJ60700.1 hypothetical protein [Qipengyuania flava]